MAKRKKYMAYGSNLNLKQMKFRCPTAKVIGIGEVKGYELLFKGSPYGAFATIEPKEGAKVPVLIWEVGPEDENNLDRYEGYPKHYGKEILPVDTVNGVENVMVYIMTEGRNIGMPSEFYLDVIKEGYREAGFDIEILNASVEHCKELMKETDYEMVIPWVQHM